MSLDNLLAVIHDRSRSRHYHGVSNLKAGYLKVEGTEHKSARPTSGFFLRLLDAAPSTIAQNSIRINKLTYSQFSYGTHIPLSFNGTMKRSSSNARYLK